MTRPSAVASAGVTRAAVSWAMPSGRTGSLPVEASAGATAGGRPGIQPFDLGSEPARHLPELAERSGDPAQSDALKRLSEVGYGGVESFPQLDRAATRSRPWPQLVRELHVPGSRMWT